MKTLSKFGIYLILGSAAVMILLAFVLAQPQQQTSASAAQEFDIPEFLIRTDALKQTAEWEENVHRVSALRARLIGDPADAAALVELARIYCIEARVTGEHGYYYPAVLNLLDNALTAEGISEKTRFEGTVLKANVLLAQHRWEEGLVWAGKALALNAHSPQVYAALIDAHVELGRYAAAVELADRMMEIKPGLMAYARVSYLRELHGDLQGAIDAMQLAVEAGYPGFENTEWCRMQLAGLLERAGRPDDAEIQYKTSLAYRGNNPFAEAGLAGILMHRRDYTEAESVLRSALSKVPEISFQEDLYVLYRETGRTAEAAAAYQGIIEMVEDDAAHGHQVDLDYATILFAFGNDSDAALNKVLKELGVRPDNIHVNSLLARIYADQGRNVLAKQHLLKATQTGYTDADLDALKMVLG